MPRRWRHSGELQKSCASSANLFAFICGPPWAWIDWSAVLTELYIEHGSARRGRENGCDLGGRSHSRDRLTRKYKLADVYRNALHPGDQDMIPAPGIQDQELSVAAERSGVNNPTVTRGCDLRARSGCQRNAFFDATRLVGTAKIANLGAIDRKCQQSLGRGKGDRRAQSRRVLQPTDIGLAVRGRWRPLHAGGRGRLGGALEVLLHLGDQSLQTVDLLGQRDGARAFRFHVLFDRALLALAFADQCGKPDLIVL